MAIYKNKDIEVNINEQGAEYGNIGANFYTEDENSASIRIYIKHNNEPVNLATAGLTPMLSLYMQDGSYFDNEPVDIVLAEQGLIQYKIRDNVIKHVGKVKATLILKSEAQSLHATEFSFTILSSGLDEQVAKEINIDLIGDKIEEVLLANASEFKGEKGEKGDTGSQGIQGVKGDKGDKGDSVLASPKIYTREEYDQLETKDSNTLYFISEV
ncbi:BppU family phage baseplate upper protein [Mammaliicoccus sp. A-M4]|uniref:BppU family phage baseplate upper protein n=1 Tax=Mammaliicoccus sp. A-M4 TaxID=2898664 RepID=UPI001EFAA6AF|nr:BppU family phage baseplate upper protein [Mammaliicoccus sp. A-M4]